MTRGWPSLSHLYRNVGPQRFHHLRFLVPLVAALLFVFGGSTVRGSDETAIKATVEGAIVAEHTLGVPPMPDNDSPRSPELQHQILMISHATLSRFYAGSALASEVSNFDDCAMSHSDGRSHYLAGGMDSILYKSMSIDGDRAIVSAEAVVWARLQIRDASGTRIVEPRGPTDYLFSLARIDNRWLIERETLTHPPGT